MDKITEMAKLALLSAVAILLIALPVRNTFMGSGVLAWIFQAPGTDVFFALAAAGLIVGFLLMQFLGLRIALPVLVVLYLAGCAHVGTLLPLLLLSIYAYGVVCLGHGTLRLVRASEEATQSFLAQLAVGLIVLSAVFWSFSAFGPRDLGSLRLFAIFVMGVSIAFGRVSLPLSALVERRDAATNFALASLLALFFALLAKTQVSVDTDSLWYGLNGDRKLFGDDGIFSANGLVGHVNYYPKLFEMIQAPFMGVGSASLLFGASLFCWIALAVAVAGVLELLGVQRRWLLLATALVVSTPCIANISIAAKGEILAAWFCVAAVYFHLRWRQGDDPAWCVLALSCACLAPLARLSVLPYAGLIFIYSVFGMWNQLRLHGAEKSRSVRSLVPSAVLTALALYVFALVNYRTLALTGVVLISPDSLIGMQERLGLHLHEDIGRFVAHVKIPFRTGIRAYLLNPGRYSHAVVFWMSNAWAFLIVAAILFWRRRTARSVQEKLAQRLFLAAAFIGAVLLFTYRYSDGGADGNYFIIPVAFGLMAYFVAFGRQGEGSAHSRAIAVLVACFIAANLGWSLATVNWNRGNDVLMDGRALGTFWSKAAGERIIYDQGLGDIDAVLSAYPGTARVVGDVPEPASAYLHASYESFEVLLWASPQLLEEKNFRNFLRRYRMDFILLRKTGVPQQLAQVHAVAQSLLQSGDAVVASQNQKFELLQLNPDTRIDRSEVSDRGVSIEVSCAAEDQFGARIRWSFDGLDQPDVSLWVESSPTRASLFARAGASGTAEAGAWLNPSSSILFREGQDGRVLRRVRFATSICLK